MQRLTYGISLGNYIDSCQLSMATTTGRDHTLAARLVNSWFHVCTSLALRPVTAVFGLGTRLRVHMHTTLENGILHNRQQPMKMLFGRRAPSCDKHRFCDKMTVVTWNVFEISLFEQSGCNEERTRILYYYVDWKRHTLDNIWVTVTSLRM